MPIRSNFEGTLFIEAGKEIIWESIKEDLNPSNITPGFHTLNTDKQSGTYNASKYPNVAGVKRLSATDSPQSDIPKRSWMGWFAWADGTPPPGIKPGVPGENIEAPHTPSDDWDYFGWQYEKKDGDKDKIDWTAQRLDQQPLYLNPLKINNNWPCGRFGYGSKPLKGFANNYNFWSDKQIVRGPNISMPYPYFEQYALKKTDPVPKEWQNSWLYLRTKPLETLVVVPSCMPPEDLLEAGAWNNNDPFPYPVWDKTMTPQQQTPFNIKIDRMGDWDADLIWEGTNAGYDPNYQSNRYQFTDFKDAGKGNYLKMTVAQGSPMVWCETNGNKYSIFYNLIRTNDHDTDRHPVNGIDKDANPSFFGPFEVPGVEGVSYYLIYGSQTNPNQPYQETEPFYWDAATGKVGGWNPPGAQHNGIFIAVFYRTDTIEKPITNNTQNHPYLCLEHKQTGKNWFVIAPLPVMYYYHTKNSRDNLTTASNAAKDWAAELGKYAFNFLVKTEISFQVSNMYKVKTTYSTFLKNPYLEANPQDQIAASMTVDGKLPKEQRKTIMALMPHHYQPITLGPDLSKTSTPELKWYPLVDEDNITFNPSSENISKLKWANKTDPNTEKKWGYWTPKGNLKTILAGSFSTEYLFQNFLPYMPAPKLEERYQHTGIQAVRITDPGQNNKQVNTNNIQARIINPNGSGAAFQVNVDPYSDQIQNIIVTSAGSGYPQKINPDDPELIVTIDAPLIPQGRAATAWAQVGSSGEILAVFLKDRGAGYRSVIKVKASEDTEAIDQPLIFPVFDENGMMKSGFAQVILGGAGFKKTPELEVWCTGTGAKAEVVSPGEVLKISTSMVGGFTVQGAYPMFSSNKETIAQSIQVHIPPSANNSSAINCSLPVEALVTTPDRAIFSYWIKFPGVNVDRDSFDEVYFLDDNQKKQVIPADSLIFNNKQLIAINSSFAQIPLSQPAELTFQKAKDKEDPNEEDPVVVICPQLSINEFSLVEQLTSGYEKDVPVSFSGGVVGIGGTHAQDNFSMPILDYSFGQDGSIQLNEATGGIQNSGSGFIQETDFEITGGKGFDAELMPIMGMHQNGSPELRRVVVVFPGSHYPTNTAIEAFIEGRQELRMDVKVKDGLIVSVDLKENVDYSGLPPQPVIRLVQAGQNDYVNFPPKGKKAKIHYALVDGTSCKGLKQGNVVEPGENYVQGTEKGACVDSHPAIPKSLIGFVTTPSQASNFVAKIISSELKLAQVFYDSLIVEYAQMSSMALGPFGAGYGKDGRDGYGMGGVLSASAKLLGVMYHFYHYYAAQGLDTPPFAPSNYAYANIILSNDNQKFPSYLNSSPAISLSASMQLMTQALQRTFTLLFMDEAFQNQPNSAEDWTMNYFAFYDALAQRTLMNPTATIPVKGAVSSIKTPPDIQDNKGKIGLKKWQRGMLWSGFGVSDQWNDQHYFYGYYLSAAAQFALMDGTWLNGQKPASEWADP